MDVRCERCRAQYAVDETRVPEAGVKVACPGCGHGFLLRRRTLAIAVPLKAGDGDATVPLPDLAPGGASGEPTGEVAGRGEWRLRQASGAVFPFRELSTLQRWIVERKAGRNDEVAAAGAGESWRRLGEIPELRSFFDVVERARGRREPDAELELEPEPDGEPGPAKVPGAEDPAWAQGPSGPPRRITRPVPPPRRPRRRLLWVSMLAGALVCVTAVIVYLHRKAATDLAARAVQATVAVTAPPAPEGKPAPPPVAKPLQEPPAAAGQPVGPAPTPTPALTPAPTPAPTGGPTDPGRVEPSPVQAPAGTVTAVAPPADAAPASSGTLAGPPGPAVPAAAGPAEPAAAGPAVPPAAPAEAPESRPAPRAAPPDPAARLRTTLARAREQRDRGRCESALDLYGQALAIDGRNATALAGRGACYLELSRYVQAEASFEAALEADPRNAEALFGLAETCRYMGRKADAVALYERFLAVRPTGDEASAARRLVVQLKE